MHLIENKNIFKHQQSNNFIIKQKGGQTMTNKKGMSDVVTTLIIILLVIAAIGIIWVVVKPFISGGAQQFDVKSKCLNVDVQPVMAKCDATGLCDVTVRRNAGGDDFSGIKMIFYDANLATYSNESVGVIPVLETKLIEKIPTGKNVTKVEVAVYFNDASGNPTYCDASSSYTLPA